VFLEELAEAGGLHRFEWTAMHLLGAGGLVGDLEPAGLGGCLVFLGALQPVDVSELLALLLVEVCTVDIGSGELCADELVGCVVVDPERLQKRTEHKTPHVFEVTRRLHAVVHVFDARRDFGSVHHVIECGKVDHA